MESTSQRLAAAFVDHQAGRLAAAERGYRQILKVEPNQVDAIHLLGVLAHQVGQHEIAAQYIRQAIRVRGDVAEIHKNLGLVYRALQRNPDAAACFRRALDLNPNDAMTHSGLGNALKDQGQPEEAIRCYRRALALCRAAGHPPEYAKVHSNLLCGLQYCPGVSLATLAEAHAEYDRVHAAHLAGAIPPLVIPTGRRLRLGFVSPDLGEHPVGYFIIRVLEQLRELKYETVCYSDRTITDDLTSRLQAAATQWRDVKSLSDAQLAEQIRIDGIDMLFDLAGHTANNRLLVFARRAAPIQITWAGYVGSTGLAAMDYLLADRHHVPPELESHYREKVLRMPDGYICYAPPDYAPAVTPLPALERGVVTFGCFNHLPKLGLPVIAVWAGILRRLPHARLVLKSRGLDAPAVAASFTQAFASHGIDPQRVELHGFTPHAATLAAYGQIDLALDPFPYSGGLTTCEALWMGVPVITCPGETFASRHSLSHLANVGLTEMIADNLNEYADLAVSLACDLPRLASLRAGLRERMAASPLCDAQRFTANLIALLSEIAPKQ